MTTIRFRRFGRWAACGVLAAGVLLHPLSARGAAGATASMTQREQARSIRLNDGWRFARLDGAQTGPNSDSPPPGAVWQAATLPHTPRLEPLPANNQWRGLCWYRRALQFQPAWRGKLVSLDFEGAMSVADVWVNGRHLATHYGGYLPFTVDMTSVLHPGENWIAVRLDNRDNPEVPPGKPYQKLDFDWYGGLYRDVRLRVTDRLHITDAVQAGIPASGGVFVTYPEATARHATVAVKLHVRNDRSQAASPRVRLTLADRAGRTIATAVSAPVKIAAGEAATFTQQLAVVRPRLWDPGHPNLYTLHAEVLDGKAPVDAQATRIGIRRISFSASGGFQINGHRMYLRGANRHQEYPYIGYAVSDEAQYRDAVKIKQAGFDYIRLSHYPQSPAFLDACDALGLVVMEPVPGWQFQGDALFDQRCFQNVRDMVRRDRNHPCVVLWETSLNETWMKKPFMDEMGRIAHEEYPGDQMITCGWQDDYDVFIQSRQGGECRGYRNGDKACLISEYGDWEYYARNNGLNQTAMEGLTGEGLSSRQTRADGERRLLQQLLNFRQAASDNRSTPAVGDGIWVMYDYSRGYAPDLETSGIMDSLRLPKFAYDFFRSQRDWSAPGPPDAKTGPMVALETWWTPESPTDVIVSSNCDEVALSLNGRLVARQKPDTIRDVRGLPHPTFTFHIGHFTPGALQAVGYLHGAPRASDTVRTPGAPAALRLRADLSGRPLTADGADVIFLYADVVDAQGTVVRAAHPAIQFSQGQLSAAGSVQLIGENPAPAVAGQAGILIRAGSRPGRVLIRATAPGLKPGLLAVTLAAAR